MIAMKLVRMSANLPMSWKWQKSGFFTHFVAKSFLNFVLHFLPRYLIDLRDPHLELKRDSPGDDGGVAKL